MPPTGNCSAMMDGVTAATGERKIGQKRNGLIALVVSCAMILLFLLYVGPKLGEHIPLFQPVAQYIEEHDIEANMYFYTEVEEFSDAQVNMINTMTHRPGRKTAGKP